MGFMQFIRNILEMFANVSSYLTPVINFWTPIIILVLAGIADLIWLIRWIYRDGSSKGMLAFTRLLFTEAGILFIIVLLPKLIILFILYFLYVYRQITFHIPEDLIRWGLLYLVSLGVLAYTREHGGRRGFFSYLGHLTVLLIGWLVGKWSGLLFLSIPLIGVYYIALYYFAQAIVPVADPDSPGLHYKDIPLLKKAREEFRNRKAGAGSENFIQRLFRFLMIFIDATQLVGGEKWQRFLILVWYTWGTNYPLMAITDSFGREHVTRINGNSFRSLGRPGLIHAQAHQAVGITTGVRFSRVDGPGTVFIKRRFERLFEVVDLRTQLRSNEIEAISKDGNPFKAILSASFAIDRQEWSVADYHRLKSAAPLLKDGRQLSRNKGSFPFSPARVRAALAMTGVAQGAPGGESTSVHWDDRVMSQLEEAARYVLAQRNLDELWRPREDKKGKSALDEISAEIIGLTRPLLQERGVHLFTARIVNFVFPENHPIIEQQIKTWSALWEQRAAQMIAKGDAEADRLQQEAKAYARSILLTSLAESLQKTNVSRPDLARNIIAMRFIGALEELIQKQPSETREEYLARMEETKQQMLMGRMKD
jgi:regulator of protease activity HflC (stomatin/prohibitin superfamily)